MPTNETEVRASIRGFITENFLYMRPDFVLGDDDALLESGVIDSMGVLEVLTFIEDTYGVRPEDEEINETNLGSHRAIAHFVTSKRQANAA